jgi:hypothetical protein
MQPQRRVLPSQAEEKHGRKGNMMKWREQLNGDCPGATHTACTNVAT